ncbi:MAG: potassium channel protein [Candidatus Aenigmarchaeota archaeon]|nr:potassium channel protein [Candidatus Aenigmarchaeota archaeon]
MKENVKEILEEMKDLSEVMLDLGYSSVFFNSKDIAKEVLLLQERLKELEQSLYIHLLAASRGSHNEKLIGVLELVESATFVGRAAKNLSELVLKGTGLHSVIRQALEQSDETITKAVAGPNSVLIRRTLGESRLGSELALKVIAIRRGAKWLFNPGKDTEIKEGDILIAVGSKTGCAKLRRIAKGRK